MHALIEYLNEKRLFILNSTTKEHALKSITEKLYEEHFIHDKEQFYNLVCIREKESSTVIGKEVAIPHLKMSSCEDFFISMAILEKAIVWDEHTQKRAKIIFLIAGPEDKPNEYLSILSLLSRLIQNPEKLEKLKIINTPKEIFSIL